ncbi:MAG: response regulator [Treponema sp.]|nr:response regulator [Treponema sp.]
MTEKKLILLVDDIEFYHTTAEVILKNTYDIVTAKSGKEAVEYLLDDNNRVPDLILLDIVMPDMDGWLTYNRLRKIDATVNIPVILLTSVQGESIENHAHSVGVADILMKPYKKNDLLEKIKKYLE